MGGTYGEIRGQSKIEVYLEYLEMTKDTIFETKIPDPEYKKHCKNLMVQDPETEEWVLHYHLHT
jgi:hypothetical protein